jgi:hypothetical protein
MGRKEEPPVTDERPRIHGLACFRLLTKITPALPHTPRPRTMRHGLEEERQESTGSPR